jgi:hypothetical protein
MAMSDLNRSILTNLVITTLNSRNSLLEQKTMAKQPEFRKYLPLEEWFRTQPAMATEIELSFDQVETILGSPLPGSAIKLATWWTNVWPKIQSHRTAWLNNGWKVIEFDQQARWVRFARTSS